MRPLVAEERDKAKGLLLLVLTPRDGFKELHTISDALIEKEFECDREDDDLHVSDDDRAGNAARVEEGETMRWGPWSRKRAR